MNRAIKMEHQERAAQSHDNSATSWNRDERRKILNQMQIDRLIEKFLNMQEERDLAMAQSDRLGKTKDKLMLENQKLQDQLTRQRIHIKELERCTCFSGLWRSSAEDSVRC